MIKVKMGVPESFKAGWYPHKITGLSHLKYLLEKKKGEEEDIDSILTAREKIGNLACLA